jgi:penicillin V acylase-like amidase (Ntn superfamily)
MNAKPLVTIAIAAVLGASLLHNSASACSRILANTNGHVVVARTMDLYIPDHAKIVVYPRGISKDGAVPDNNTVHWTSKYGSVTVNSLGVATSDGMNEKGLVANRLYLHGTQFVNGVKVVHRGKDAAVMTNEPPLDWQLENLKKFKYFGGTDALPGDIDPASRFVRASAFLKTVPAPNTSVEALEEVYSIIKTVSVPQGAHNTSIGLESEDDWPTLWTSLADSANRLYFFQSSGSPNMFWIDLGKVDFAAGTPVKFVPGDDISLNGEISKQLQM